MLGRQPEHSLRELIAELVQEAADEQLVAGEQPELDRQERALIANVLRLRETTADDVMVPRADIVAMRVDVTLEQALEQIRTDGHSRLPVYREQLDDIIGMVHIKDVFAYVGRPEAFSLEAILRRPLMVAPQMPVLDLLLQMRQQRMHLALVIDEYGGVDGLVTIEDLVETIVGDISDEHDEVQAAMVVERADGALDINARLPVEEFETRMGPVLSEDERDADIDTVGGLVFTLAGPGAGEGRGDQPSVGDRVPRAGRRSAADPAAAGAAGGGGDGGRGGGVMPAVGVRSDIDCTAFASECAPVPAEVFVDALLKTGFSPEAYRDAYGDLRERGMDATSALRHYIRFGLHERRPVPIGLNWPALADLARLPAGRCGFPSATADLAAGPFVEGCQPPIRPRHHRTLADRQQSRARPPLLYRRRQSFGSLRDDRLADRRLVVGDAPDLSWRFGERSRQPCLAIRLWRASAPRCAKYRWTAWRGQGAVSASVRAGRHRVRLSFSPRPRRPTLARPGGISGILCRYHRALPGVRHEPVRSDRSEHRLSDFDLPPRTVR